MSTANSLQESFIKRFHQVVGSVLEVTDCQNSHAHLIDPKGPHVMKQGIELVAQMVLGFVSFNVLQPVHNEVHEE